MRRDSYHKIIEDINKLEEAYDKLPKGYIRIKNINGKEYAYLQYRDHEKVKSVYLNKEAEEKIEKEILDRKNIETKIRALRKRKKDMEKRLGIHEYIPEKGINYDEYALFMSQLAHDLKRLGTEGFIEKYDTSKYRGLKKRYLKGYINYILDKKEPNTRKSNKLVLDPYTYLMYFKYDNKDVLADELSKAIPQFLNQGLLITSIQEAVHA